MENFPRRYKFVYLFKTEGMMLQYFKAVLQNMKNKITEAPS